MVCGHISLSLSPFSISLHLPLYAVLHHHSFVLLLLPLYSSSHFSSSESYYPQFCCHFVRLAFDYVFAIVFSCSKVLSSWNGHFVPHNSNETWTGHIVYMQHASGEYSHFIVLQLQTQQHRSTAAFAKCDTNSLKTIAQAQGILQMAENTIHLWEGNGVPTNHHFHYYSCIRFTLDIPTCIVIYRIEFISRNRTGYTWRCPIESHQFFEILCHREWINPNVIRWQVNDRQTIWQKKFSFSQLNYNVAVPCASQV